MMVVFDDYCGAERTSETRSVHAQNTLHVPLASLENVLDLLHGILDVVGDDIALALRRERVGVVCALARAVLGFRQPYRIVSPIDIQRKEGIEYLLPLTRM